MRWEQVTRSDHSASLLNQPPSAPFPPARTYASAAASGSNWFIAGGRFDNQFSYASDVWVLNTASTLEWIQLDPFFSPISYNPRSQNSPYMRYSASMRVISLSSLVAYLPTQDSSFHLPAELETCTSLASPALLISRGYYGSPEGLLDPLPNGVLDAWLFVPPCGLVTAALNVTDACTPRVQFPPITPSLLATIGNWTIVPLSLGTGTNFLPVSVLEGIWYWLPDEMQEVSVGGLYSENIGTFPHMRIYDFAVQMQYDLVSTFSSASLVTQVPAPLVPEATYSQTAMLFGRWMYVWSAGPLTDLATYSNYLWRYHVDEYRWELLGGRQLPSNWTSSAESLSDPSVDSNGQLWPRWTYAQTIVQYGGRFILQFGGLVYLYGVQPVSIIRPTTVCAGPLYVYDTFTSLWSTPNVSSETAWNSSNTQGAALTGGYISGGYLYPKVRCSASMTVVGDAAYFTGGFAFTTAQAGSHTDNAMWRLNLTTFSWKLQHPTNLTILKSGTYYQPIAPLFQPQTDYGSSVVLNDTAFLRCLEGTGSLVTHLLNPPMCTIYHTDRQVWSWFSPADGMSNTLLFINTPFHPFMYRGHVVFFISNSDQSAMLPYELNLELNMFIPLALSNSPQGLSALTGYYDVSFVPLEEQHEILMYGGYSGVDNATSDPAVHVLNVDDASAGGVGFLTFTQMTSGSVPRYAHDWLATLSLTPSAWKWTSFAGMPVFNQFATVAGAMAHLQRQLAAGSMQLQVVDTSSTVSPLTAAFLSTVPLIANVTLSGDDSLPRQDVVAAHLTIPSHVLDCSAASAAFPMLTEYDCNLVVTAGLLSASGTPIIVQLRGLRIVGGRTGIRSSNGGSLYISASMVRLQNVELDRSSSAGFGGAVHLSNGVLQWSNGYCSNSCATLAGGCIYASNSVLQLDGVQLRNNNISSTAVDAYGNAYGFGGAIAAVSSQVSVVNSLLSENRARIGGAISLFALVLGLPEADALFGIQSATLQVAGCSFVNNSVVSAGGALYLRGVLPSTTQVQPAALTGSTFEGNIAGDTGGAIHLEVSTIQLNGSTFFSNEAGRAGGAVFWQWQQASDSWASSQPQIAPSLFPLVSRPVSMGGCTPQLDVSDTLLAKIRVADLWCNIASYGPTLASPSATVVLTPNGSLAASLLQTSGAHVDPPLQLEVLDAWRQRVSTEDQLVLSVNPLSKFAGGTSARALAGVITFDSLIIIAEINTSTIVGFSPSQALVLLDADIAAGLSSVSLTTSRTLFLGLQVQEGSGFQQVASCSSLCTLDMPMPSGVHSVRINLTFDASLFRSDTDQLKLFMAQAGTTALVEAASFDSSQVALMDPVSGTVAVSGESLLTSRRDASTSARLVSVSLWLPSSQIRVTLQTADNTIGYVSATFTYTDACPPELYLDNDSGYCMELRTPAKAAQITLFVFAGAVELVLLAVLVAIVRFRSIPCIQATNVPFHCTILSLQLLLPLAGVLFAMQPAADSDALCAARFWLSSLPVIGVLAILLAKAARIGVTLGSQSLEQTSKIAAKMWLFVTICLLLQVALCVVWTVTSISRSVLATHTSDGTVYLVRECSLSSSFTTLFILQLVFLCSLILLAAYVSFLSRDAQSVFNESVHNSHALFILVLMALVVIPVAFLVRTDTTPILVLQSGTASFLALAWAAAIFAPKLYAARHVLLAKRKQKHNAATHTWPAVVAPGFGSRDAAIPRVVHLHGVESVEMGRQQHNTLPDVGDHQIYHYRSEALQDSVSMLHTHPQPASPGLSRVPIPGAVTLSSMVPSESPTGTHTTLAVKVTAGVPPASSTAPNDTDRAATSSPQPASTDLDVGGISGATSVHTTELATPTPPGEHSSELFTNG